MVSITLSCKMHFRTHPDPPAGLKTISDTDTDYWDYDILYLTLIIEWV